MNNCKKKQAGKKEVPFWYFKAFFGIVAFNLFWPYWLINFIHKLRGVKIHDSKNTVIAYRVTLDLIYPEYIEIESGVWLTQQVTVLAHYRPTPLQAEQIGDFDTVKKVRICQGAYIGTGAFILPGVTIGKCAVVGAGSVVTKDVPPFAVSAGNPARVIKRLNEIRER